MSSSSVRPSANSCAPALLRLFAASLAMLVTLCLASSVASAATCTLTSPDTWMHGANGTWNVGSNWSSGVPNSSSTNTCITDGSSTVTLDVNVSVASLQLASGNALDFNPNTQLSVYGAQILNAGQININGGGNSNSYLYLSGGATTTLSGGGTVTLNTTTTGGGGNAYLYLNNGTALVNMDNAIQGEGIIFNNGSTISNQSGGTINANSTGSPLVSYLAIEYGSMSNAGLLEATNSGDLILYNTSVNNAGGNITANGANAIVDLQNSSVQGGTFNTLNGGTIETTVGYSATLDGSTGAGAVTINGTYLTPGNSSGTSLYGSIINKGNFQVNGGGNTNGYLYVPGNVSLTGGGTVTLQTTTAGGSGNANLWLSNGITLDNVNNTIQGEGIIYNNGTVINNHAGGVINASQIGSSPLYYLQLEYGTVNNLGLMEATNGGQLGLYTTTVNNAGGNITNNTTGSTAGVYIYNTSVVGGNLNNNTAGFFGTPTGYFANLDGSTGAGAVTVNGTYTTAPNADTYLYGSIVNNGSFQVNGGGNSNTYLYVPVNVSLTGNGTVSLSTTTTGGGGNANLWLYNGSTLDNVNNTIQGEGILYNNGTVFNNHTAGIVNANSTGGALISTLALEYGTFNNTGLMEATNNGTLQLYSTTVNNAGGGVISANGPGASVILNNTTIQGGSLNNNGGAFFGTPYGYNAYLDGSTSAGAITLNGTYTSDYNTDTNLYGNIVNNNNIQVNGGNNTNTYLYVGVPVTLTGGGTVSLSTGTTGGGGNANLWVYNGTTLDNVNNTIQGEGIFYANGTVVNNHTAGIINANSTGSPLINTLSLEYGTFNNTGLMEATNNGILELYSTTVNNSGGGVVSANGPGASVTLYNTTIQGGSLNNNGGAFVGTFTGYSAYLDGSTTAGALTLNGTYTADYNTDTYLYGTINNQGNLLVNGGNNTNTYLWNNTASTVTLTGGGTVSLSTDTAGGGGLANLYLTGGSTLDNINNTIQGEGLIYMNGATIVNEVGGTIAANSPGSPYTTSLRIDYGTVTNNGTFQVSAGNTLWMFQGTLTNYAANTLTGGTYSIYGTTSSPGTLQVDYLGTTGGEIINNAATIYLNGPNSNFVDQSGLDALSNFNNNTSTGSFTITNGRNFTSPGVFSNAGAVNIGSGSTFSTSSGSYNQSGGSTKVDGALAPAGHLASFAGGTLLGNGGTITGNVNMSGTISPGDAPGAAGALGIVGNYAQLSAGVFQLELGGLVPGSQFDLLNVSGTTSLSGTLDVSLINSFFPAVGNTFTFLNSTGGVSGIFGTVNGLNIGGGEILSVIYGSNYVEISTSYSSTTDLWNGGTGVWSNGSQWSIGVPQPAFDTIIYSGGNDDVTMDVGSSTVNSLTVGGPSNGFSSILSDNGTAQTLVVTNGLTVGAQGALDFTGSGSSITAASVSNNGYVLLGPGVTLNLTSQPNGVTSVAANSTWEIAGNFAVGGVANTGFANLANLDGSVLFENGTSQSITPALTISSTGKLTVKFGASLNTAGINNSGSVLVLGSDTLSMSGSLTNDGSFVVNGSSGMATMTGLTNNAGGFIDVDKGATMTVNGNVVNNANGPQGIYTGFNGNGGNTIQINGTLTNNGMVGLESSGDMFNVTGTVNNSGSFQITGGAAATFTTTLLNSGTVDLENASTLKVNGAADNFGTMSTSANGGTGSNTMTVSGLLTNEASGQISVNGPSDTLKAPGGIVNKGSVSVKNGSTIDPPYFNNLGTLNIDGTSTFVVGTGTATGPGFVQLGNGTFGEMINSATAFGVVNVAGPASLNGTLDILLQSGYNPAVGTSFTYLLLSPGQLTGTYSTILNDIFNGGTEMWVVNYNDAAGYVQLTAASTVGTTPEPGTFLMLGSGLIGIAFSARRRFLKK
jgi:PEP-CTERM motif